MNLAFETSAQLRKEFSANITEIGAPLLRASFSHRNATIGAPTVEMYGALQIAYDFFNYVHFDGLLKPCLITLQRRSTRTLGHFSPQRFVELKGDDYTDEIALNPRHFSNRSLKDVLSVLVHEMVHLWQFHFGHWSRGGYHNKQFGAKMKAIGLHPSNTGMFGGRETGQQMSHYIIEDGPFDQSCKHLQSAAFELKWAEVVNMASTVVAGGDNDDDSDTDSSNRSKFSCPKCDAAAWGKPDLKLICGECRISMPSEM